MIPKNNFLLLMDPKNNCDFLKKYSAKILISYNIVKLTSSINFFVECKFSASGREDVDVKMLGNGKYSLQFSCMIRCLEAK